MDIISDPRPPTELPTESELMSTWKGDPEKPFVTVLCTTYNHEPFISDAIHGFLIQRTTFPYRVLIHDDASTDRTQGLIKEYADRYPKIIKAIYQNKNLRSRGLYIRQFVRPLMSGKYIARCEGDDYWSDSLKLDKQIKFMESHSDCVMSFHPYLVYDDELKKIIGTLRRTSLTATLVHKNIDLGDRRHFFAGKRVINGDRVFKFLMWRHGTSEFIEDIGPAIYRHHSGGMWSKRENHSAVVEALRTNLYLYYEVAETKSEKQWAGAEVARCLARMVGAGKPSESNIKEELQRSTVSLIREFGRFYPAMMESKRALSRVKTRITKRWAEKNWLC